MVDNKKVALAVIVKLVLIVPFYIMMFFFLEVSFAQVFCSFYDHCWNFNIYDCFSTTTGSCYTAAHFLTIYWSCVSAC